MTDIDSARAALAKATVDVDHYARLMGVCTADNLTAVIGARIEIARGYAHLQLLHRPEPAAQPLPTLDEIHADRTRLEPAD